MIFLYLRAYLAATAVLTLKKHLQWQIFSKCLLLPILKRKFECFLLHNLHLLTHKIVENLSESGIKVSRRTVIHLVSSAEKEKYGQGKSRKRLAEQNQPTARSSGSVRKVAAAVNRANPPIQNQLAYRLGISQSSVNRILSQDLDLKIRKKRHAHNLTEKHAAQRLERGPHFLTYLGMFKARMIFTMDETVITLNDLHVGRNFYFEGEKTRSRKIGRNYPESHGQRTSW